jgi:hypothetical protein
MNKLMAGAGLALAAWLCSYAYRSARRQRETHGVREEVKRWEGEGGSVAPAHETSSDTGVSGASGAP